ncbi:MAG: hypothetical protein WBG04_10425 [Haloferula sp.]
MCGKVVPVLHGPFGMTFFARFVALFIFLMTSGLRGQGAPPADPIGFATLNVPAGSQGLLAIHLVKPITFKGFVADVDGVNVEIAALLPANLLGSVGSGFLSVRQGRNPGLTVDVDSFVGSSLTMKDNVNGLLRPGDQIDIRPHQTIAEVFNPDLANLFAADLADEADTIFLWNPENQVPKGYFIDSAGDWLEIGNESAGDQSATLLPYPGAVIVNRRADTELDFTNVGTVLEPAYERVIKVWPGRNLISAPFTSVERVDEWQLFSATSDFSLQGGPSAAKADAFQLTYANGTRSNFLYYRQSLGWRSVGVQGDAGSTPVDVTQAIDLHRYQSGGYLRIAGEPETVPGSQALMSLRVAPVDEVEVSVRGGRLVWAAELGKRYQLQARKQGRKVWEDFGEMVTADGPTCEVPIEVEGSGLLRVIAVP